MEGKMGNRSHKHTPFPPPPKKNPDTPKEKKKGKCPYIMRNDHSVNGLGTENSLGTNGRASLLSRHGSCASMGELRAELNFLLIHPGLGWHPQ